MNDPALLAPSTLIVFTLLSACLVLLRIREHLAEKPDPKLTYATLTELDKLRNHIQLIQRDNRIDLERIRNECRTDHTEITRRFADESRNAHSLIHKNAEHIAALIAQQQTLSQRLHELTIKTDKLATRLPTTPSTP